MKLSPIAFFTYNRLEEVKKSIQALKSNFLAKDSKLIIFSDGPKTKEDSEKVLKVREFLKTIDGFHSIEIFESDHNLGLANSIINGVSKLLNEYDSLIILEDDLLTSSNFLDFMNQGLYYYKDYKNVISICGYSMNVKKEKDFDYDVYFTLRSASWGWAIWKDRWFDIDWEVSDFKEFQKNKIKRKEFNKMGSDMSNMLINQQLGKNNSWAIRFCYHQFKYGLVSVYPFQSKIRNIGFSNNATHTKLSYNRFDVDLDTNNNTNFVFDNSITMIPEYLISFRKVNSISQRLISKIRSFLKF